jgi:hypothetical protein
MGDWWGETVRQLALLSNISEMPDCDKAPIAGQIDDPMIEGAVRRLHCL